MGATNKAHVVGLAQRIAYIQLQARGIETMRKAKEDMRNLFKQLFSTDAPRLETGAEVRARLAKIADMPILEMDLPDVSAAECLAFLEKHVERVTRFGGFVTIRMRPHACAHDRNGLSDSFVGETLVEALREAMRCNPHLK